MSKSRDLFSREETPMHLHFSAYGEILIPPRYHDPPELVSATSSRSDPGLCRVWTATSLLNTYLAARDPPWFARTVGEPSYLQYRDCLSTITGKHHLPFLIPLIRMYAACENRTVAPFPLAISAPRWPVPGSLSIGSLAFLCSTLPRRRRRQERPME